MKARIALVLVGLASVAVSCDLCFACCANYDTSCALFVSDAEGRNKLDPATPGHIPKHEIWLYTLEDGKLGDLQPVNISMFDVGPTSGRLHLGLVPQLKETKKDRQLATTIIKWSDTDMDTVEFEVIHDCGNTWTKSVRYNGQPIPERTIEVTK
jgi:hypothetical protein